MDLSEKVVDPGRFGTPLPAARIAGSPRGAGGQARKRARRLSEPLYIWWRWRELNPRPQILRFRYYMFFLFLILTRSYPTGRENHWRFRISFSQSTPDTLHDDLVRVDAWNLNAQARLQSDGTLLVIKQRARSCRRWQLNFLQIFTRLYPSTCT
jgi:hypothetical protein